MYDFKNQKNEELRKFLEATGFNENSAYYTFNRDGIVLHFNVQSLDFAYLLEISNKLGKVKTVQCTVTGLVLHMEG